MEAVRYRTPAGAVPISACWIWLHSSCRPQAAVAHHRQSAPPNRANADANNDPGWDWINMDQAHVGTPTEVDSM